MRRRTILAQKSKTLAEQYEERFGKKPHWKMKPETIAERLKNGNARVSRA